MPASPTSAPGATLWTVQIARAAAALMVVVGHAQSVAAALKIEAGGTFQRVNALPWGASVDLFFVISGFIMVHAARRLFGRPGAAEAFVRRRLARIVPLYWLTTAAYLLLLVAAHLKGGDPVPGPLAVAASFLFIPFDTLGQGRTFPVFDLGWTLNYEMFFYALFAVGVGWGRRGAAGFIAGSVAVLVIVGLFVPAEATALHFWTRPIMVDFVFGLGVGLAAEEGVRLRPPMRWALVAGAVLLLTLDPARVFQGPLGFTVPNEWPRVLMGGVPAAALLAGATLGPAPPIPALARPAERLGDASYSLYLFHPFAMIVTEKVWQKVPASHALPGWALVLIMVAGAIALAMASFRWIEQPLTARARRLLETPRGIAGLAEGRAA